MKRKLILCSLMLCIAGSSMKIDAWPSRASNLWPRTSNLAKKAHSSIIEPIAPFLPAIAMHCLLFRACKSMTYKDRLKQHILFILYANLTSHASMAIHELGHAIAATLTGNGVSSIEVNSNLSSLISLMPAGGLTRYKSDYMYDIDEATRNKDYSTIRAWHIRKIFTSGMGPILGFIGTYAMLRTYQKFKTSAKKISSSDTFWIAPLLLIGLSDPLNLIPFGNSDGAKILFRLKGLKELYNLEQNGDSLEAHTRYYFSR